MGWVLHASLPDVSNAFSSRVIFDTNWSIFLAMLASSNSAFTGAPRMIKKDIISNRKCIFNIIFSLKFIMG